LAGLAGGCHAKALYAAEANELRCYARSRQRLPDQRPLSTRCLIDRRLRTFTAAEQRVLDLLAALVRYLFTHHGVRIPVPAELLAQVKRRLLDLQDGPTKRQC
jgi:hypothetical protein